MGLHYARQEARLRAFIRSKQEAGVIPDEIARDILGVNEELYRTAGMQRDSGDQKAFHSLSEIQTLASVQRKGYYQLERKLLEHYPGMIEEIRSMRDTQSRG
jgi:hypothetical protein